MPSLVDYFAVCGLSHDLDKEISEGRSSSVTPPLSRSFACKILSQYPDRQLSWNSFDDGAVRTLCMPDGLLFKKNVKDPLVTSFHTFLITREDASHSYGNVLTFYEPVKDIKVLNVLESLQQKYSEKKRGVVSPADEEHCFSLDKDELFAPKCLCFVTSQPIHEPFRVYLEQLFAVSMGSERADLPVESYLYNLLYEVPMPSPGKSVNFIGPLGKLTVQRPSLKEFPLCDYSFKLFFELLGVRNVVKLLSCILLEHQVLVKSSDYERLMLICHCSTTLLFPFAWPHVFVPFLPASQRAFLDAPVPYIMGLRIENSSSGYLNLPNVASLCTVNVDSGTVECPDELPALPNERKLILELTDCVQTHCVKCPDLPNLPSSSSQRLSFRRPSIIDAFKFVQELTDNIGPENADLKKLLTEAAINNSHIPNLINIATRAGIKTPLSPTLSLDEGAFDLDDEEEETHGEWDYLPDKAEAAFASAVREVFADFFVEQFANYENFIIMPHQSYEQWQQNREHFQNFDRAAFISDQPAHCREFYSAFLETSMFSGFIDDKIVTFWDASKTGHMLSLFESRVESYHDNNGVAKPPTTPGSRTSSFSSEVGINLSVEVIAETAPLPHLLTKQRSTLPPHPHTPTTSGVFPALDAALLKASTSDNSTREQLTPSSKARDLRRGTNSDSSLHGSPGPVVRGRRRQSGSGSGNALFSSHSHAKFVNQLMRESRLRVKHMLGSSGDSEGTIEENTHIAYLCDLLERIWGHGLKKRDSKSPLWAHLMAYGESVGVEEFSPARGRVSPPHPALLTSSMSSLAMHTASTGSGATGEESPRTSQTLRAHFRRRKFQSPQLRARVESILHPRPPTLLEDLSIVHQMRELKTDVGRARAWVRLALENKSLSRHLSKLLEHKELIIRRYREYAFIGTDEEREQFLYHLLTLTARDFSCFTTGFLSTTMTYRVLVVGEGKHFGLSTACLYVQLAGEAGETGAVDIPRGEYQTNITCNNLGPLTCLRLGHDNSGITPSLFVEMVLVHNFTTGQTYRFNCGHWFARSEEDGSVERFLVANKVPQTIAKSGAMSALDVDSVLPPSPGRRRSPNRVQVEEKASVNQLKLELKLVMDKIRTSALSKSKDSLQELLQLIHGPSGFFTYMDQVFNLGFRCTRKFQKRLYPWDLLERVCEQLQSDAPPTSGDEQGAPPSPDEETQSRQMFMNAVSRINSNNLNIGKEEKLTRFLGLGLRDHYLYGWISLLAQSPVTASLYEPLSFFHDPELLQNLLDALTLTMAVPIRLEPLFTQNL